MQKFGYFNVFITEKVNTRIRIEAGVALAHTKFMTSPCFLETIPNPVCTITPINIECPCIQHEARMASSLISPFLLHNY
jgi:hypothetical protein